MRQNTFRATKSVLPGTTITPSMIERTETWQGAHFEAVDELLGNRYTVKVQKGQALTASYLFTRGRGLLGILRLPASRSVLGKYDRFKRDFAVEKEGRTFVVFCQHDGLNHYGQVINYDLKNGILIRTNFNSAYFLTKAFKRGHVACCSMHSPRVKAAIRAYSGLD